MHAPARVDMVQWLGGVFMLSLRSVYAIRVNYLHHLCKKAEPHLWRAFHAGV
jgi:hypothetical protein